MPRIVVERASEVDPGRFYVMSAEIEAHGHTAATDAVTNSERSLREP